MWERYRIKIIEETHILEMRRIGRITQRRQHQHLSELKSYYYWLRTTTPPPEIKTTSRSPASLAFASGPSVSPHPERPLFPPLTEFLALPMVNVLLQKHSAFDTFKSDLYNPDGVLRKLIQDNVDDWMDRAKLRLANALGHKHAYYSSASNLVNRATALFACRLCGLHPYPRSRPGVNGLSDPIRNPRMDTSGRGLTFEALLSHQCSGEWKNERTLWSIDHFVPDENAIQAMRAVLAACHIREDHQSAWQLLDKSNPTLMCESCAEDDKRGDNLASVVLLRVPEVVRIFAIIHLEFMVPQAQCSLRSGQTRATT